VPHDGRYRCRTKRRTSSRYPSSSNVNRAQSNSLDDGHSSLRMAKPGSSRKLTCRISGKPCPLAPMRHERLLRPTQGDERLNGDSRSLGDDDGGPLRRCRRSMPSFPREFGRFHSEFSPRRKISAKDFSDEPRQLQSLVWLAGSRRAQEEFASHAFQLRSK
jgi:hypothetical protein